MDDKGRYSKAKRRITEPVITVSPEFLVEAPKLNELMRVEVEHVAQQTAKHQVEELDKDRLVVRKQTGWLAAGLVAAVLIATAYVGSAYFTREHQVYRLQQNVEELTSTVESQRRDQQKLERRLVELETQLELLRPPSPEEDE